MKTLLVQLPDSTAMLSDVSTIASGSFLQLILRFALNTGVLLLLVRWLYYSSTRRKDYLFTYMMIGTIVFLLCFILGSVKLQLGFALGLFAIFGIIRYRTTQMPIKEMTYLFLIIGISVINALASNLELFIHVFFTNAVIVFIAYGFERLWLLKHESVKIVVYERIDLIKPEKHAELIEDLQTRTGLIINRVEIGKIDFLKDVAQLSIYYYSSENRVNLLDDKISLDKDDDS